MGDRAVRVSAMADVTVARSATASLRSVITRRILDPVTGLFLGITLVIACLELAGWTVPMPVQLIPFAVSILVFGLPHGALDHLVPARVAGVDRDRGILGVCALYLVLGSATAAVWIAAPVAAFALFILVTWFHWGQGDLWIDRLVGDGQRTTWAAALTVAARGAIPMLIPLAARPADYRSVVQQTVHDIAPTVHAPMAVLLQPALRGAAATLVLALIVAAASVNGRGGQPLWRRLSEEAVLVAFFIAVPPVLAVGLYFTLWHSVRHVLRLELLTSEGRADLGAGHLARPLMRFFRDAWPITSIAVAILIAVSLIVHRADLGVYLILIAALTTPHAAVVSWMDRRQRVWRRASRPLQGSPRTAAAAPPDGP